MEAYSEITETRTAFITKDVDDIIVITMKEGGLMDEYDMADHHLVVRLKSGAKPALKLIIANSNWKLDKRARKIAKKDDQLTIARAIVSPGFLRILLGNVLFFFRRKNYPERYFADKEKAKAWLLKQR